MRIAHSGPRPTSEALSCSTMDSRLQVPSRTISRTRSCRVSGDSAVGIVKLASFGLGPHTRTCRCWRGLDCAPCRYAGVPARSRSVDLAEERSDGPVGAMRGSGPGGKARQNKFTDPWRHGMRLFVLGYRADRVVPAAAQCPGSFALRCPADSTICGG